jgi:hypothetical protein
MDWEWEKANKVSIPREIHYVWVTRPERPREPFDEENGSATSSSLKGDDGPGDHLS